MVILRLASILFAKNLFIFSKVCIFAGDICKLFNF